MTKLKVSGVTTVMARTRNSKKTAAKIPPGVEERIVEVSLKHPGHGASRLVPVLEQEGIQVSTTAVYAILKRNDLHTKSKRLSKLEAERAVETPPEPASTTQPEAAEQDQVPAHIPTTKPQSHISPSIKAFKKTTPRPPWSLSVPNLLLLGVVGYFWASAIGNFLNASRQPLPVAPPPPADISLKTKADIRPLDDYNIITKRNLFRVSEGEATAPQEEEVSLEGLPVSLKVSGFKLLGTVASDDSTKSFAILHSPSTRKQELYREGDKVGEALLKKILRNKVVLNTNNMDEVLTMELEETPGHSRSPNQSFSKGNETGGDFPDLSKVFSRWSKGKRSRAIKLDRKVVESSFSDLDQIMQQVKITPYKEGDQPSGFKINRIKRGGIFAKMGLRNGDVIQGVNDEAITTPEQAMEFYQSLAEGGEVSIEIKRGNRKRKLRLNIE